MIKSILIGSLLGGSLLLQGFSQNKKQPGLLALAAEVVIAVLAPGAAFPLYLILALCLLALPAKGASGRAPVRHPEPCCVLVSTSGPLAGRQYLLRQGQRLTIGRQGCDVLFPPDTPGIGHYHCSVAFHNGAAVLVDEQSTYGTFLLPSGRRLSPRTPWKMEDCAEFCLASRAVSFQIHYSTS